MGELGKKFKEKENITVPRVDIESVKETARKESYRRESVYEDRERITLEKRWYTLWLWEHEVRQIRRTKVGEREVFDAKLYLDNFKRELQRSLEEKINDIRKNIENLIDKYRLSFDNELKTLIEERNRSMDEWKRKKQTNEEIIAEIEDLKDKKNKWKNN